MKNKVLNIILGIALVVSVGANIFLMKNAKDGKGEIAVFSEQVVIADNQITDIQKEIYNIQEQIREKGSIIAELMEKQTDIQGNGNGVDVVIPDDFEYVDREAEEREQPQPTQPEQKPQQQQPTQPTNPEVPVQPNTGAMPGGTVGNDGVPVGGPVGDGNGSAGEGTQGMTFR